MPLYALGDLVPSISGEAFVHPDAVIIGAVHVGAGSSIWPGAVLRGDDGEIHVGERSSIQDGTVVHTVPHAFTRVGNDCVVGHLAHLEGCRLADRSQVSSGAVVLHEVEVGEGAIVAANAVVLNGTKIPPGALAVGAPAQIKEGRARSAEIAIGVEAYLRRLPLYSAGLRRID